MYFQMSKKFSLVATICGQYLARPQNTLIFVARVFQVFEYVTFVFKPTDCYHELAHSQEQVPLVKTLPI